MGRRSARSRARSHASKTRGKPHAYSRGHIQVNPRGFGFVQTAEGEFFIPASKMRDAFDGDLVEISHLKNASAAKQDAKHSSVQAGHRPFARVVRVIERAVSTLVGRFEKAEPFGVVIPEDPRIRHDIFTLLSENPDIEDGALVRVRITQYPTHNTAATGVVEEVLGSADDLSLLIERVISRHKLETCFSDAVLDEATHLDIDIFDALAQGYRDIRERFVFTIDPADAKDFDDALSIDVVTCDHAQQSAAYRLGVHIADVSHYVAWGSSIDLEARRRATSVYLPDRVIPMLPERLSNDLCSLRPHEDRLCMSVDIYLDASLNIVSYDLYPAIMRSDERLSYDEARAIIDAHTCTYTADTLAEKLTLASEIAEHRRDMRLEAGGIEFQTKEARVKLDDAGNPVGIDIREKNIATSLIEEAMICANEIVATELFENDWPCAYRDHEPPTADRMQELVVLFQEFSWFTHSMAAGLSASSPFAIEEVLAQSEGRLEHDMVTMLLLRAMTRAVYAPENLGHFGLGLDAYCHFTSPIRRYPDLIVHRMLKAKLTKRPEKFDQEVSSLKWLCEHSSEMERIAEEASYECNKALTVVYMEQFIGTTFSALISGVATYGIYVRLDDCVEGLVPIRGLGDEYFVYDPLKQTLRGSESRKLFRLGQKVSVVLQQADTALMRLTFALA